MRRATAPALLLILLSVVLGATVFREQVAQAAANLMVREQNTDAQGNIKVHEQGTANVNVTNASLSLAPQAPITDGGGVGDVQGGCCSPGATHVASALVIHMTRLVTDFQLLYQGNVVAYFDGPAFGVPNDVNLALSRPIKFDQELCIADINEFCRFSWVGNLP